MAVVRRSLATLRTERLRGARRKLRFGSDDDDELSTSEDEHRERAAGSDDAIDSGTTTTSGSDTPSKRARVGSESSSPSDGFVVSDDADSISECDSDDDGQAGAAPLPTAVSDSSSSSDVEVALQTPAPSTEQRFTRYANVVARAVCAHLASVPASSRRDQCMTAFDGDECARLGALLARGTHEYTSFQCMRKELSAAAEAGMRPQWAETGATAAADLLRGHLSCRLGPQRFPDGGAAGVLCKACGRVEASAVTLHFARRIDNDDPDDDGCATLDASKECAEYIRCVHALLHHERKQASFVRSWLLDPIAVDQRLALPAAVTPASAKRLADAYVATHSVTLSELWREAEYAMRHLNEHRFNPALDS